MPTSGRSFFPSLAPGRRAAVLLAVTVAVGFPFWGIGYAFAYSLGLAGALSHGFTLEYWSKLTFAGDLNQALFFSASVALATVFLSTMLALALARILLRIPAGQAASASLFVPLAIPTVVAALLSFQFFGGAGLLARVARLIGLIRDPREFPALIFDRHGLGIILTHTALAFPVFALLFVRLYANERVADYVALARTLGAGRWAIIRRVAGPLLLRRAAPALTLLFASVFGSYEIPLLLGAQRPEMLSILARRKFALFDLTQRPEGFLIAVIYAIVVFTLVYLVFRNDSPAHVS